ncbi:RHS repeat-associated core domain-containing protein [Streptomyces sp. NPDC096132]|uniref:RHS repeat-associated core domain-containing protein n=1 Tax=Streptomyces sp. NPDC096132 TaxID=3366075 RepID=UPI0038063AA2
MSSTDASKAPDAESASAEPEPDPSASPEPSESTADGSGDESETISPDQVDVRVLDRQEVAPAGGIGLGVQVIRTDGVAAVGQVQISIDYSGFQYAYGGDFASRLRLVKLPACALQTPEAEECSDREFVPAENDTAEGTLTATVVAEPDADGLSTQLDSTSSSVYALTSGSSSESGDYRASTLSPTGSWDVATGSGAFTYSYPFSLPTPAMGRAPSLALSYNSQSVDGRTSASNNQASWVGMGWDLNVGYIERRYRNCSEDGLKSIGDMCWASPNRSVEPDGAIYVINLNGVTSTLVQDDNGTGSYHVQNDPGWRVQHLSGGYGADDEYWVISTQDGQRYYFGWGRSERSGGATSSVFTIPVVGNNTGEPCYSQFPEPCTQAWRWSLDRTVDANEVESVYFYDRETNYYRSVANTDKARSYTASGYLAKIEYGWPTQIASSKPTGKVEFTHTGRCVERMADADPLRSEPDACPSIASSPSSYPDVPVDLLCNGTSTDYYCAGKTYYPTFFSKDMLWDVKTFALNTGANGWDLVQQYQTKHGLPNPDGAVGNTLWLDYLQRETYGTGNDVIFPVVNFNGTDLDNQVGTGELNFRRISTIHGDLGATTSVTYDSPNPCSADALPSQASNTKDCYWQKWTPEGATTAQTGWFKKFLVSKVTVDPTVTSDQDGAPVMTTTYDYQGGAGWRFTDDPLVPDSDETWSDWRGYQRVEVTNGTGTVKHSLFHWLFRGLDGDRTSKTDTSATRSVSVTDGEGTSYTDSPWLQSRTIESSTRDDAGSSQQRVFHHYWTHNTSQYDGLPDARFVREDRITTETKISTGWRTHVVEDVYDDASSTSTTYGLPVRTDDQGEQGVSDNRCTTYGRAYNTDLYDGSSIQRWMILVDETRHYAERCDNRAAANQDGYTATLFDGASSVDTNKPVDGNATEVRTYTKSSAYQPVKSGYDDAGRVIWTEDANSNRTTTTYSPANVWPLNGITTTTPDPDGLVTSRGPLTTTAWTSRYWGMVTQTKDANGNITKVVLDGAGRPIEVWKPTETGTSPSLKFDYSIPTATSSGIPDSVTGFPRVGTHILQAGTTYLTSYAYSDGLGRARETHTPIPDGTDPSTGEEVPNRQVAVVRYDSAGNVTGTSAVFRNQGTAGSGGPVNPAIEDLPSYTELTLDWAGRTTESQILVGDGDRARGVQEGRKLTAYHGDYVTVTPAAADPTDTYTDVYGQTSKVVEHNGSSAFTTQYDYTATGLLKQITDARDNTTAYTYDWAGQRTRVDDPDAGISTTTYDANGRVSTASGNIDPDTGTAKTVLSYQYDTLGRRISVNSGTTELAAWTWDGLGVAGGKGQITATTSHDADGNTYTVKSNGFDGRGRSLSTTVTIPAPVTGLAGDYTTAYTYDAADHIATVTYPQAGGLAAETVTAGYTAYGQPRSLTSDTQTYVRTTVYDAYGLLTDRYYGAATTGLTGVSAQRSYNYVLAKGTRWLRGITTTTSVGQFTSEKQQDLYDYDYDGKITGIQELAAGQTEQTQCFHYDGQARLTNASTRAVAASCSLNTTSDFTGEDPYQTAYTYDRLGNLQLVTDTNATGEVTTRDYLYPGYDDADNWTTANADQPHGVRKVTTQSAGTTTAEDLTYDDAGQMLTRVETAGSTKATDYTWSRLGQLASVKTTTSGGSELTRYAYDADGNLLVRTTPQETVAYLGGMELRTSDGTAATATRYYSSGTSTVAMRTTTGNSVTGGKLFYLMADPQASTQLVVDADTGKSTRRRYTPFGDERDGSLPTGTDSGFLGKTEDTSTGLSLLGARAYDPRLARFLSPDPLSSPYTPQNLSAYSYSENDPVNRMDPTGLESCYPLDCSGEEGDYPTYTDDPIPSDPVVTDLGDGAAPPPNSDLGKDYLGGDGLPSVGQMKTLGTYMPNVSDELNYELYFRERCTFSQGVDMSCKNLMDYYGGWAHVKSIDTVNTCPICGNVGFDIILQYALGRGGKVCFKNSFTLETEVLMADGTSKPIKDVAVGEKIIATDPESGATEERTVLATIVTDEDKDFTEVGVETEDGPAEVVATDHHPFWSPSEHAWLDAGDLRSGMTLRTDRGDVVTVETVSSFHGQQETRNLTVDGLHTYYVLAGKSPVLVHNAGGSKDPLSFGDGYTGRLDRINIGGTVDFEIHVYRRGTEVGIFGSNGWFPKHGKSADVTVPQDVYNNLKGLAVGEMRAAGRLGGKGTENIKGDNWKRPRITGGC